MFLMLAPKDSGCGFIKYYPVHSMRLHHVYGSNVCPSGTVDCGVGLASGGTCKNQLVTKESSNWNKEEYNAAMIGPEHNPKAVYTLLKANGWYKADLNKDSASAENYDDFNFPKPKEGSISECLKISSETKLKLSASSEYWGENCFYMDETNSNEYGWSVVGSGVDRKLVITKEPGVYELHNLYFKDDKIISICKQNGTYTDTLFTHCQFNKK